jgi:hypothetical protein
LDVSITHSELAVLSRRGHVVCTSYEIVDVQAVVRVGYVVVASFETELVATDESTFPVNSVRIDQKNRKWRTHVFQFITWLGVGLLEKAVLFENITPPRGFP